MAGSAQEIIDEAKRERAQELDFSGCWFDIPESIGDLVDLRTLNVSRMRTTALPSSIGNLKSLLRLIASGSKLKRLPETVGRLSQLEQLDLSDNQLTELEAHLKVLQHDSLVEMWFDRKIEPGKDWKREIDERLNRADIILLLVSASFLASDYCTGVGMKRALERHHAGAARVVPIIVRDVNWGRASLQALPRGKPVDKWANRASAWRNVSELLEGMIEQMPRKADRAST